MPRHMIGVGVVGFNDNNQILLLRHVFHPKAPWGVPGGWLDRNESPSECALRELKEETGLTAVLGPIIYASREGPPPQIVIAFVGYIERDPVCLSSEIIEWGWFDPEDLPGPLLPFVEMSIKKAVIFTRENEKEMWGF